MYKMAIGIRNLKSWVGLEPMQGRFRVGRRAGLEILKAIASIEPPREVTYSPSGHATDLSCQMYAAQFSIGFKLAQDSMTQIL